MKIIFNMSCGHAEEREIADPDKCLKDDCEYYEKQGVCSSCWAVLCERLREEESRFMIEQVLINLN